MNCKYCGSSLSMEDRVCPYCGRTNEQAAQHIKDMDKYHGAFTTTQRNVYGVVWRYKAVSVRMILFTVLVLLIVGVTLVSDNLYSIQRRIRQSDARQREREYTALLDTYLEEENFQAFKAFTEAHSINSYSVDAFYSYSEVQWACSNYIRVYEGILEMAYPCDNSNIGNTMRSMLDALDGFYNALDSDITYRECTVAEEERNSKALAAMEQNVERLFVSYIGLTPEEATGLRSMTQTGRERVIFDRWEESNEAE